MSNTLADIIIEVKQFATAYDAGYECGLHGPSDANCNVSFFANAESMQEWTRGSDAGKAAACKLRGL